MVQTFEYEGAPLVLAFVLGPMLDLNLRQALLVSEGSFLAFFTHPISAVTLGLAAILLITSVTPFVAKKVAKYREVVEDQ